MMVESGLVIFILKSYIPSLFKTKFHRAQHTIMHFPACKGDMNRMPPSSLSITRHLCLLLPNPHSIVLRPLCCIVLYLCSSGSFVVSVKDGKWQGENIIVLTKKERPSFVSAGCEKNRHHFWGSSNKYFFLHNLFLFCCYDYLDMLFPRVSHW